MSIVETVVAGLLTSEVQGVVGSVKSRIVEEIQLAWGFQKELEELKGQFTTLSELLQGASGMRVTNQLMADWLKKIKDVAEEADNLLDEWSYYKALEQRTQTGCWDLFVHIISQPFYSLAMAHKVKDIRKLIASIENEATKRGIQPVKVAAGDTGTQAREIQDNRLNNLRGRVDLQYFEGRDDDVKELVKLLCDPNNTNSHLTVIGIVGLAGLGKTTLSKHISRASQVTNFFNNAVIWLVVSHNFDLEILLKQMVEKVFGEASGMSQEGLIDKLRREMEGKKFLIILDDVWDTVEWEPLKSTLHDIGVSQGTTLLVTSRDKYVVEKSRTLGRLIIHQLKGLSQDDSWILFMKKFLDKIEAGTEEEQIAKRMIDKCGGVPLAIRVLADLLRGKRIEKWREIEESETWTKEDRYGILPSLRLSYNYLPPALKKCFAFCAIFEEDAVIEKQKLIYMWMAQGFLQPNKKILELEGEDYIEHLLNSSLFQDAELDENGNVYAFKMHDLVWSLAGVVSKGECLCLYRDEDLEKVRHLLVSNNSVSGELTSASFKKLQTCMLSKEIENPSLHIWFKCKQLRVLVIGENWSENTDWKPLGKLIHLRYFEITAKHEKDIKHFNLPDQITKLYHLQTLIIDIPDFLDMSFFKDLSKNLFPKGLGNLVNLRHILTERTKRIGVPMGLSHLSALQTLPIINLGLNWGGRISDMRLLTNLRGKLEIHCLTLLTTVEEGRSLDLCRKSNLDSLVLRWGDGYARADKKNPKANEIVEALQPHENLHKLELQWFDGTAFPKWLMGPGSPLNNIVSLQIDRCVEAHGDLKLKNFIRLRILKVVRCKKLIVTFPNNKSQCCKSLEELEIIDCEKVELPDLFLMPKLQVIEIRDNNSTSRDELVGLGSLSHLKKLHTDLKLPVDLEEESPVCKSLKLLTLIGSKYYKGDTTDLPDQLQHLVALEVLSIDYFRRVEAIPNWLGKLTSLQSLYLSDMPKLKQLPPQDVMQTLSNLTSLGCGYGCPLLEEDIKNKRGEWFKIVHYM